MKVLGAFQMMKGDHDDGLVECLTVPRSASKMEQSDESEKDVKYVKRP